MKKYMESPLCALTLSLTAVLLAAGLAVRLTAALAPAVILPHPDIPAFAALALAALALEAALFGRQRRFWATTLLTGAVDFGVLALCAGWVPTWLEACRAGILGGAVLLLCELLLHSALDRLSSGPAGKYPRAAAAGTAVLLWLAVQSLASVGL